MKAYDMRKLHKKIQKAQDARRYEHTLGVEYTSAALAMRYGVTEVERENPFLLHAKVGACLAKKKYGVKDKDILNAIQNHTTGRPGMSLLEKIVFIADYIEPGRNDAPNLDETRKLAFTDLDRALLKILKDTLDYLESGSKDVDPMTRKTYEYYSMQKENE